MRQPPLQHALVWHSYLLAAILGLLAALWTMQALLCLILLVALEKRLWRWQRLAFCALLFAAGFAWTQSSLHKAHSASQTMPNWESGYRFCGQVANVQGLTGDRLRVLLKNVAAQGHAPLPGICAWTWDAPLHEPVPGQTLCLTKNLKPVSAFANSRSDSYLVSLFSQNIYWRTWSKGKDGDPQFSGNGLALARLRNVLKERFLDVLREEGSPHLTQARAILMALLFGDRHYLSQKTTSEFASATLAHSLALSGQHLAIAGLIGTLLVLSFASLNPNIYLIRPRRIWIAFTAFPLALLYLWIGNLPPSLLRAAGMLAIGAIWLAQGRCFSGIDLLGAALILILICDPLAIFNIGLQLSALCVATILIAWPGIARLLPERAAQESFKTRLLRKLKIIFAVSLVIQLALLPLTLARFQLAGFWFPLNLIWLPALGAVVLPCAFSALLFCSLPGQIFGSLAQICVTVAAFPCQTLLNVLGSLSKSGWLAEPSFMLPGWPSLIAFALLACVSAWIWGNQASLKTARKTRFILALSLCLLAIAPFQRIASTVSRTATIEALDVGQGQAILVSLPGSIRILIDGGGNYFGSFDPGKLVVAPLLALNSRPGLSAVINTHPDLDHLGGLFHILETFQTRALFHNGRESQNPQPWRDLRTRHGAHTLAGGDTILAGKSGWKLEALSPPKEMTHLTGNAASLVLRIAKDDIGMAIFPGDAPKENLRKILDAKIVCQAKIVFAPHHGSDKNFLPAFYESTRPDVVIACCGFMNRWRYPGKRLRAWLAKNGISLFDTGIHGKVKAVIEGDKLTVTTIK